MASKCISPFLLPFFFSYYGSCVLSLIHGLNIAVGPKVTNMAPRRNLLQIHRRFPSRGRIDVTKCQAEEANEDEKMRPSSEPGSQ